MKLSQEIRSIMDENPDLSAREVAELVLPKLTDVQRDEYAIQFILAQTLQIRNRDSKTVRGTFLRMTGHKTSSQRKGKVSKVTTQVHVEELSPLDKQLIKQLAVPTIVPGHSLPIAFGKLTVENFDALIADREGRISGYRNSIGQFQFAQEKIRESGLSCLDEVYVLVGA